MTIATGVGRSREKMVVLPRRRASLFAAGLLAAGALLGYAIGQASAYEREPTQQSTQQEQPAAQPDSLEDRIQITPTPVVKAPSIAPPAPIAQPSPAPPSAPQKPAMPDLNMMVTDYAQVRPLVEYIANQLGYPMSRNQQIKFLSREEFDPLYKSEIGTSTAGPAFTTVRFRGDNVTRKTTVLASTYLRQDAFYNIIGPLFHEIGIFNFHFLNANNDDSHEMETGEAGASALHSAFISKLEEDFGLENIFVQTKQANHDITAGLEFTRNSYFNEGFRPAGGLLTYWGVVLKEPKLEHIGAEVRTTGRLSSSSEVEVFKFLVGQSNAYVQGILKSMTSFDFREIEQILTSRAVSKQQYPVQKPLGWDFFFTRDMPQISSRLRYQNL